MREKGQTEAAKTLETPVFSRGIEILTEKYEFVMSAWVQVGIGSLGGGEMDLTGVVAIIPKKQLMTVLEEIKKSFSLS